MSTTRPTSMLLGVLGILIPAPGLFAANLLNPHGQSGAINTPNAYTLEHGVMGYLYSNQTFNNGRFDSNEDYLDGNNFNFAFGLFDHAEIAIRNSGVRFDQASDLSAHLKLSMPLSHQYNLYAAVGEADFGGVTQNYNSRFAVLSHHSHWLDLSAGLRQQPGRNKEDYRGFFTAQLKPASWLNLLYEIDDEHHNQGVIIGLPESENRHKTRFYFGAYRLDKSYSSELDTYYSLSVQIPLTSHTKTHTYPPEEQPPFAQPIKPEHKEMPVARHLQKPPAVSEKPTPPSLQQRLWETGFDRIALSHPAPDKLRIDVNNDIFNANAIDALGVLLGMACNEDPFQLVELTLRKQGIALLTLEVDGPACQAFFRGEQHHLSINTIELSPFKKAMQSPEPATASHAFKPRLIFSPVLSTVIGSEVGMFDYSLGFNMALQTPLWSGGVLHGSHDFLVDDSEHFEERRAFSRYARENHWQDYFFSQSINLPLSIASQFNTGRIYRDGEWLNFLSNESMMHPGTGELGLGIFGGYYSNDLPNDTYTVLLGTLYYHYSRLDTQLKLNFGQFFYQDVGFKLESIHFFGDTRLNLYLQHTDYDKIGLGLTLPLGPRKDRPPRPLQVTATQSFHYGTGSVVNNNTGTNPVIFGLAKSPLLAGNLYLDFFNSGRLSQSYIEQNALRMREAYYQYRVPDKQ